MDQAMSWQPIETAPECQRVLVFLPTYGNKVTLGILHRAPYRNRGTRVGWRISDNPGDTWRWLLFAPTHWMPLPPSPVI
jgi:hypothetical protein